MPGEKWRRGAAPLLLLPDCGQTGASWPESFLQGLGTGLAARRPDWPTGSWTTQALAAWVREELWRWRARRAHVLGVGLGALVALELAMGRRRVVDRLVVVGGHPGVRTAVPPPSWVAAALASALAAPVAEQAAALWPLLRGGGVVGAAAEGAGPGLAGLGLTAPGGPLRAHWAATQTFDGYARLPRIARPTLVLHGGSDVVVVAENGRTLVDRVAGAEFALLPGAGHWVVHDAPAEAAARVRAFLRPEDGAGAG